MAYSGGIECKLDDKGRIMIPAAIKSDFPKPSDGSPIKVLLKQGFEKCVEIYLESDFHKEFDKILRLRDSNAEERMIKRAFYSRVRTLELDANGRILIPKKFLEHAQIDNEIMLIKTNNKIELWNARLFADLNYLADDDKLSQAVEALINDEKKYE